jgi:exodeoxyribonuclease-3
VVSNCDVVCLQETRVTEEQINIQNLTGDRWHAQIFSAQKKGYSGVATFSRKPPDDVILGLENNRFDQEGRVMTTRFGNTMVVNAYFPNSQHLGQRLDYKLDFCSALEKHLDRIRKTGCEVLLLGDYNIAHQAMDLARPKQNEKNAGYLPEERDWFSHYLSLGYRDVFRELYPKKEGAYTWWSFRAKARDRNIGWRLDYATTTQGLGDKIKNIQHHTHVLGSDHCPLSVET